MDNPVKIALFGDKLSGRSSLVTRVKDAAFDEHNRPSYWEEAETPDKIGDTIVRLSVAPSRPYRRDELEWYMARRAHASLVVFDSTSSSSFRFIESLVERFEIGRRRMQLPLPFVLVTTKVDLESDRVVDSEEARAFAEAHSARYIETSAKTGQGVHEAFQLAIDSAMENWCNDNAELEEKEAVQRCITH